MFTKGPINPNGCLKINKLPNFVQDLRLSTEEWLKTRSFDRYPVDQIQNQIKNRLKILAVIGERFWSFCQTWPGDAYEKLKNQANRRERSSVNHTGMIIGVNDIVCGRKGISLRGAYFVCFGRVRGFATRDGRFARKATWSVFPCDSAKTRFMMYEITKRETDCTQKS